MNSLQFPSSYSFDNQNGDSNSMVRDSDSDCDSTVSDFFASELQGWEPSPRTAVPPVTRNPSSAGAYTHSALGQRTSDILLTPDASTSSGDNSVCTDHVSASSSWSGAGKSSSKSPKTKSKKKRMPVPTNKKDDKYWERRRKNNLAAKRSRELKREKTLGDLHKANRAIQENERLKAEIGVHKSEIESLRRLLRDANTTLALWIKARQATEPFNRLPPSMRNSDGLLHFVDFPQ